MATTNFALLTNEELTLWKKDVWRQARNLQFINKFTGSGSDAMIQRITELTKTRKGARAVITLVKDLVGDGRVGDNQLEENEEAILSQDQVIQIDQLRHANRHEGKMADQRSVVTFRENSRNVLAYWLADRLDQIAFLIMSGVALTFKPNGATRVGSEFPLLDFAGDITAPSTNRHTQWTAATGLKTTGAATNTVLAADVPTWGMLVDLKAYAEETYLRPIRTKDGIDFYHVFMSPTGISQLKQDSDFLANVRNAGVRGEANQLFKGTNTIMVDGMAISSYRHVFNTRRAVSGSGKWGAGANIDGQRVLFCGAQAMGYADIGEAEWVEKEFDYNNQPGIAVGKIVGFKKPVFENPDTGTDEDFGLLVCDTAI